MRRTVGLFGILGGGNIGNDAQLESLLGYMKRAHPDVALDAMCSGPDRLRDQYGIDAIPLRWQQQHETATWHGRSAQGNAAGARLPRIRNLYLLAVGMVADVFRIANWVRRHDLVIVPGAGVLETSMLVRPWSTPYVLLLLCASGKIFRTKVALVCVGGNVINQPLTRWIVVSAAKLASYRSYRDEFSRDSMRAQGVDTSRDRVYADLSFGIAPVSAEPVDTRFVGVGLYGYYGTNDDRKRAKQLHEAYLATMFELVRWLADTDRRVVLLVGDTNGGDDDVVVKVLADLRAHRPDLPADWVIVPKTDTFADLMTAMAQVHVVVASRFHNVMCALKLAKPTVTLGYSRKHDALMAEMGLGEFCQPLSALDSKLLLRQVEELESRSAELTAILVERHAVKAELIERQFKELSGFLS